MKEIKFFLFENEPPDLSVIFDVSNDEKYFDFTSLVQVREDKKNISKWYMLMKDIVSRYQNRCFDEIFDKTFQIEMYSKDQNTKHIRNETECILLAFSLNPLDEIEVVSE